ncbi:ribose ABC transporter permease, partial [Metabacillus sp. Hm71]
MKGNIQTASPSQSLQVGNILHGLWNRLGMIMILLLLCVVLTFTAPNFLDTANMLNVLKQVSIIAILAAGMTIVILTGGID